MELSEELKNEWKVLERKGFIVVSIGKIIKPGLFLVFIALCLFGFYSMEMYLRMGKTKDRKDQLIKQYSLSDEDILEIYARWFDKIQRTNYTFLFLVEKEVFENSQKRGLDGSSYTMVAHRSLSADNKKKIAITATWQVDINQSICAIFADKSNRKFISSLFDNELNQEFYMNDILMKLRPKGYDLYLIPWNPPIYFKKRFQSRHSIMLRLAIICIHLLAKINDKNPTMLWKELYDVITTKEDKKWKAVQPEYEVLLKQEGKYQKQINVISNVGMFVPAFICVISLLLLFWKKELDKTNAMIHRHKTNLDNYPEEFARAEFKQQQREAKEIQKENKRLQAERRQQKIDRQQAYQKQVEDTIDKAFEESNAHQVLIASVSALDKKDQREFMRLASIFASVKQSDRETFKLDFDLDVSIRRGEVIESLQKKSHLSQLDELQHLFNKINDVEKVEIFEKRITELKKKIH